MGPRAVSACCFRRHLLHVRLQPACCWCLSPHQPVLWLCCGLHSLALSRRPAEHPNLGSGCSVREQGVDGVEKLQVRGECCGRPQADCAGHAVQPCRPPCAWLLPFHTHQLAPDCSAELLPPPDRIVRRKRSTHAP